MRWRIKGFQASEEIWSKVIATFLRDRTGVRVAEVTRLERHVIHRMLTKIREVMYRDEPEIFSGTVEIDETYVGGQWRNKPWSVRKFGTKRGHGTSKQAIFGILNRNTKQVKAYLIPNLQKKTMLPIVKNAVTLGSIIYTDGYTVYTPLKQWYKHHIVDHVGGEYVRGKIHTNGIESFWGYLKRRLKITGGIRPHRFHLFVAEEVWRFNHRSLNLKLQTQRILNLLVDV